MIQKMLAIISERTDILSLSDGWKMAASLYNMKSTYLLCSACLASSSDLADRTSHDPKS